MKNLYRVGRGEKGSALIVVLMILLVLSLMGTTGITTSETEVKIATNLNMGSDTFYASDGALELGNEILNDIVNTREIPSQWSSIIKQTDTTNTIVQELTILGAPEGDDPDVVTTIGNSTVTMDIDFVSRAELPGSSIEFGGGYEGVGKGSHGGFANFYKTVATASRGSRSTSVLENGYRKTIGVGG